MSDGEVGWGRKQGKVSEELQEGGEYDPNTFKEICKKLIKLIF